MSQRIVKCGIVVASGTVPTYSLITPLLNFLCSSLSILNNETVHLCVYPSFYFLHAFITLLLNGLSPLSTLPHHFHETLQVHFSLHVTLNSADIKDLRC